MRRCLSCWDQARSRSAPRGSRPCWEPSTTRPFAMCMWRRWICASSTSCSVRRRCCHERAPQIRTALMENLKELHLPAMRECFEQAAHQAEKETLSYEQYLLQLTERECEAR